MPIALLKKLPPHAQKIWESTYQSAKAKYGPSRAAAIAMAAVKKKYNKVNGKWMAMSELAIEPQEIKLSTEKLFIHSEGNYGETEYFVEGYLAKSEVVHDERVGDFYLSEEALKDAVEQANKLESFTGDLEHINPINGKQYVDPEKVKVETNEDVIKSIQNTYDGNGWYIKALLNKNLKEFPEIWKKLQNGLYNGLSLVAYGIDSKSTKKNINNNLVTIYDKIRPLKFTLTTHPRMVGTRIQKIYKSS